MTAEEKPIPKTSDWPFMCGLCHNQSPTFEQFYQHLQTHDIHISNQLHTCQHLDVKKNRNAPTIIQCQLCNNKFTTLCTFHDHFIKCGNSGSYIFDYPTFQAYPLSEFCAYFENREHLQQESREPDSISETSEITKNKTIFKNYIDTLSEVFQQMKDNTLRSDQNVCDVVTQVSLTEDEEMQVVNNTNQKLDQSTEDSENKNKSNTGGKDKTGCGSNINTQSSDYRQTTNKTKKNLLKSEGQKQRKVKRKRRISSQEDVSKSKSVFKVDYKNKMSEKNNESIDNDDDNDVGNHLKASETKQEITTKVGLLSAQVQLENTICDENTMDCDNLIPLKINEGQKVLEDSDTIHSGEIVSSKEFISKTNSKSVKLKNVKNIKTAKKVSKYRRNKTSESVPKTSKHKKTRSQTCETCGKVVPNCRMKFHQISHSDVRAYACDQCPKTYKYPVHLKLHKRSHEKVLPFYCEICGQGFVCISILKRHSASHNSERPFKCEVCEAGFVTRFKLKRHMAKHTGEKTTQCDLCGMRFTQKENLNQHISGVHRKEKRFSCTECDRKFQTNYQLKCHMMKHAGLKPYKCTMCNAAFVERKELRRHMKKLHKVNLDEQSLPDPKGMASFIVDQIDQAIPKDVDISHGSQISHDQVISQKLPTTVTDCVPQSISISLPVFVGNEYQSEESISHDNGNRIMSTSQHSQIFQTDSQLNPTRSSSEHFPNNLYFYAPV